MREARVDLALRAIVLGLSVRSGATLLLRVWIVPILLGRRFLRLFLLAEHGRCPFVADMFETARTLITNGVVRALPWNMPYRAEHHRCPTIPFDWSPGPHRLAQPLLGVTPKGHVSFIGVFARGLRR